jgi:hypothetical protein
MDDLGNDDDDDDDNDNKENETPVMIHLVDQSTNYTPLKKSDAVCTAANSEDDHPKLPEAPPKKAKFPSWTKYQSFIKKSKITRRPERRLLSIQRFPRRNGKHPGIRHVLSPKALYPGAPPKDHHGHQCWTACNGGKIIQASGGGSSTSASAMPSSGGGSGGGSGSSSNSSRMKRSANAGGSSLNNNNGELDLDNLDYPDSPTSHKWFADNSDLSPLTVLDNINLKTEFPYSTGNTDVDKPPDIHSITLDTGAEHLFQFAASVPNVPDNTTTFLDIGADTFSQSLYDDLGDINMNDFPSVGAFASIPTTTETIIGTSGTSTFVTGHTSTAIPTSLGSLVFNPKPITLEKVDSDGLFPTVNLGDLVRLTGQHGCQTVTRTVELGTLLPIITNGGLQSTDHHNNYGSSVLKGLIEPLPESALKGLIKIESTNSSYTHPGFIKVEQAPAVGDQGNSVDFDQVVFSPLSLGSSSMASPGSPGSDNGAGGGKMKSSRKKSTASNTSSTDVVDEDDISNIASLQTRINIISSRVRL